MASGWKPSGSRHLRSTLRLVLVMSYWVGPPNRFRFRQCSYHSVLRWRDVPARGAYVDAARLPSSAQTQPYSSGKFPSVTELHSVATGIIPSPAFSAGANPLQGDRDVGCVLGGRVRGAFLFFVLSGLYVDGGPGWEHTGCVGLPTEGL